MEKKNIDELFVIRVTNKEGLSYFVCETEAGIGFSDKIFIKTKLFYEWNAARQFSKKFEKNSSAVRVIKMSEIINSPEAEKYGIQKHATGTEMAQQGFVIVGYTDDNVKHWIHFDTTAMRYFPKNSMIGACMWYDYQIDDVITMLRKDKSISIKHFEAEKINN